MGEELNQDIIYVSENFLSYNNNPPVPYVISFFNVLIQLIPVVTAMIPYFDY